jgi:flagellar export protein FliJ
MADLNPLIRVRKHAVEQKQKFLAELYRQAEQLADQKRTLKEQMAEEQKNVAKANSADMLRYFGTYVEAVKGRIRDIDDSMKKLDVRIVIAREDMREAFAEFKKIEITQDRREAKEAALLEKKQAQLLDEMALDGFRRQQAEG